MKDGWEKAQQEPLVGQCVMLNEAGTEPAGSVPRGQ